MLVFKKMLLLLESVTWEEKLIGFHQMEPQQKDDSWPDVSEIGTVYRQMGATVPLSVQIHGSVLKECQHLGGISWEDTGALCRSFRHKADSHDGVCDICPWIYTHVLLWVSSQSWLESCVAEWNHSKGTHTAGLMECNEAVL